MRKNPQNKTKHHNRELTKAEIGPFKTTRTNLLRLMKEKRKRQK